ncbi:transposase, partial [Parabacteroides distasonis]|nr:transposase [Parabacteroides distasonis]
LIAQILTMHFYYNMTIADIEGWLQGMGLNFAHTTVINWIKLGAEILAPLDDPLHQAIITSGEAHGDESTLGCKDKRLPDKDEKAEDVEDDLHYFKRWIFCYYAPLYSLTQFVFYERGRRTQEAVKKYFEDVMDKLYLHSDGAPIYKCYDVGELILRIACLVHMRRPFFKLKDFSKDAMLIMKLFDTIYHEDKKIKEKFSDPEDIRRERCACLGPLFNDLKNYLDRLGRNLKKEDEPELLKAVNYAL